MTSSTASQTNASSPEQLLQMAQRAFDVGNYAQVSALLKQLESDLGQTPSADPSIGVQAAALKQRLTPSPLSKYLVLLTALCLLAVTAFAYLSQ